MEDIRKNGECGFMNDWAGTAADALRQAAQLSIIKDA